jgi:hypothetical protein
MARRNGISTLPTVACERQRRLIRCLVRRERRLLGASRLAATYVVGQHGSRCIIQIQTTRNRLKRWPPWTARRHQWPAGCYNGYIVSPFSTVEIDGFRRSLDTVAAFRFGTVRDSYAAKKGTDRNVGVVGVAFFHERGSRWPWTADEVNRRHNADPFPGEFKPFRQLVLWAARAACFLPRLSARSCPPLRSRFCPLERPPHRRAPSSLWEPPCSSQGGVPGHPIASMRRDRSHTRTPGTRTHAPAHPA